MALIKIKNDAFNIAERIKKLNPYYFVVYNTKNDKFEVHNSKQTNTFCITCENGLNYSVIQKLRKTNIENIEKILREIESNNEKLEQERKRVLKDEVSFKAKEMFNYAAHHEGDCTFDDSYKTRWA